MQSLESARMLLWNEAGLDTRHVNGEEAQRKLEELQKESSYL